MFFARILLSCLFLLSGLSNAVPAGQTGGVYLHPFYVSVSQVHENEKEKALEITCKIFTDDFEKILRKNYNSRVDLLDSAEKVSMGKLINNYIKAHFSISVDGKDCYLRFIGFEQDEEAVDCYFQVSGIAVDKTVAIVNNILFDYRPEQVNIVHVTAKGVRKSIQLINPDSKASFDFP
ncbi:MAG: DUF6702 family protein [Ginsengibacter sp.]